MPWAPRRACGHAPGTGECRACKAARDRRRPSRQARGLGAEYERERRAVLKDATHCVSCGRPFTATRRPTAGHVIPRVQGGGSRGNLEVQCHVCNYGEGSKLARSSHVR